MRIRKPIAAVACAAAFALPAPPAHAALAAVCTFDGTLAFTPPLTVQPASGTWAAVGTVTCVQANAGLGGATWGHTTFVTAPACGYAGSCVQATFTDGYGLSVTAAGAAVTTVWTSPFVGVQTGTLTPVSGSCLGGGLATVRMLTAGPGAVP